MSDKSGVSAQALSLPSGGGAVEGAGGKFQTRQQTGAGSYSIPLSLPAGRRNLTPSVDLAYDTGNGNGEFGLGWTIGLPQISRKTSGGVPVYDETDTFLLSGGTDLVPVDRWTTEDGTAVTRYQSRTESEFARVERRHSESTDHWVIEDTDGTVRRYGRPDRRGEDPAVVADPADRDRVFRWHLSETVDSFGNRIEYDYRRDAGESDSHLWDGLSLDRIRYVDYEDDDGATRYLVTVDFEYEARPDPFSRHKPGFEVRTTRRCSSVVVRTDAGSDRPFRTYELSYVDELPDREPPANGLSHLARVDVVGHGADGTERLPPLEFEYAGFDPSDREFEAVDGPLPPQSLSAPSLELADVRGDGLPDLVEIDDTVRYWRNLGDGEFDEPREMGAAPAGLSLADPEVQLLDADGDGRVDLVSFHDALAGYFPLSRDGGWAEDDFQPYDAVPSVSFGDPAVERVDLDGDGITDAMRSGATVECFFQDDDGGWVDTRTLPQETFDGLDAISFADDRVRLADMTGDGLLDVVFVESGHVSYWPNQGRGDWGRRVTMRSPPDLPADHDPDQLKVGDVDGDGAADFVYVEDDRVRVWLNRTGEDWMDPVEIDGTPPVSDADAVRLVDLDGHGIDGLLYSAVGRGNRAETYFLAFIGETKPYLMTETRNNTGARTRLEYEPSTAFSLADERAGEPWETTIPSPRWVVSRVEVRDLVAKTTLVTEYEYHHGHWDGAEREFRGFGRVDKRDASSVERREAAASDPESAQTTDSERFSPPKVTRTWFHLGPVGPEYGDWSEARFEQEYWPGDPRSVARPASTQTLLDDLDRRDERDAVRALRGKPLRTEVYAEDGSDRADRPYEVAEYAYGVRREHDPDDHPLDAPPREGPRGVYFPHRVATRESGWERGDDPKTQFSFQGDYDDYGQQRWVLSVACPRGWQPGRATDEYLATVERSRYATPTDGRCPVDRRAEHVEYEIVDDEPRTVDQLRRAVERGDADTELVELTRQYYDGDAYDGRPLGEVGPHGANARTEQLVLTDEIRRRAYDAANTDAVVQNESAAPYLTADAPAWSDEYPESFRDGVPDRAGYHVSRDLPADVDASVGYFTVSGRRYDHQTAESETDRGLLLAERDGLGNESEIRSYDPYALKPVAIANPEGLVTRGSYDYDAMKVREVTDPNGNRQRNGYTPLGRVAWSAVLGTAGEREADTPEQPTVRYEYDLHAFERSPPEDPRPVSVHSVRRKRHRWDVVAEAERDHGPLSDADIAALFEYEERDHPERFVRKREYSDGFGRVVQERTRAEDVAYVDDDLDGGLTLAADDDDPGSVTAEARSGDGVRVSVTGWNTYDNKGNVVESFESFFDEGWGFTSRVDSVADGLDAFANATRHYYDPLGREIRTVAPDGSESRTVRGELADLGDPDGVDPSPWVVHEYDAVDNAGRTHPTAARDYGHRWDAPTTKRYDPLGNEVEIVRRNREPGEPAAATTALRTRVEYDVTGNRTAVRDALGRVALSAVYDLSGTMLRYDGLDAGSRIVVTDAADNELERRDGRGAIELKQYDAQNRPTHHWARDDTDGAVTLRHRIVRCPAAGEFDRETAADRNLLGKPIREYDEAGRLRVDAYDFTDNATEKTRTPLADDAVVGGPVDWTPPDDAALAEHARASLSDRDYRVSTAYNALGEPSVRRYPADVTGDRKETRYRYTASGALSGVDLVSDPGTADESRESIVEAIGYDAEDRRSFVAYGNGVMTRYAYDPVTHRLARIRSERFAASGGGTQVARVTADGGQIVDHAGRTYAPTGVPLQDRFYEYDVGGSITEIRHESPGAGVKDGPGRTTRDRLVRSFRYDALGQLRRATGREGGSAAGPAWGDRRRHGYDAAPGGRPTVDPRNMAENAVSYTREYEYDPAGNMTRLHHAQGPGGSATWTRRFGYAGNEPRNWDPSPGTPPTVASGTAEAPNRLTHLGTDPATGRTHDYDACGNLRSERNARYAWDFADRLRRYEERKSGETSVRGTYAYDADGNRVKKVVDKGDRREVTVYIDGVFQHHRLETAASEGTARENNEIHVSDDEKRVAVHRVGTPFDAAVPYETGDRPETEYHLPDHLGNSSLVTDGDGGWVNREEYTPFGETALGGYEEKRYRFGGKERDEESGLYYHGTRYYAPWLCRWTTTDPAGPQDGLNLYRYVSNDPVRFGDPSGTQVEDDAGGGESGGAADAGGGETGGSHSGGSSPGSSSEGGDQTGKQRRESAYIVKLDEENYLVIDKKEGAEINEAYGISGDLIEHLPSDIYAAQVTKTDEGVRIKKRFVFDPKKGDDGGFVPLGTALTVARAAETREEMAGGAMSHEIRRPRPAVRRKVKTKDGSWRWKKVTPTELAKYRRKKLRTLTNSYWACIAYSVEHFTRGSSNNETKETMGLLSMRVYHDAQSVFESAVEGKHLAKTGRYTTPGNTGGVQNVRKKFNDFAKSRKKSKRKPITKNHLTPQEFKRRSEKMGESGATPMFKASQFKSKSEQMPDNPADAIDMVLKDLQKD